MRAQSERWRAGLVAGLVFASLAILWERLAFPGLLNFSSDYRTTALFWEMHVGGAALDGFLALTAPFAVREVLVARVRRAKDSGGALSFARRICMPDDVFARGLPGRADLRWTPRHSCCSPGGTPALIPSAALAMLKGCALIGVMSVLSYLVFRAGGYRSLLAVLGVFALTLPFGTIARGIARTRLGRGTWPGCACRRGRKRHGHVSAQRHLRQFRVGIRLLFAAPFPLRSKRTKSPLMIGSLGAYVWLIIAAAGVALGWGGVSALRRQRDRVIGPDRVDAMERAQPKRRCGRPNCSCKAPSSGWRRWWRSRQRYSAAGHT